MRPGRRGWPGTPRTRKRATRSPVIWRACEAIGIWTRGHLRFAGNAISLTVSSSINATGINTDTILPLAEAAPGFAQRLDAVLIELNNCSNSKLVTDFNKNTDNNQGIPGGVAECISVDGGASNIVTRYNDVHTTRQYGIDNKAGIRGGAIYGNRVWDVERFAIYLDAGRRFVEDVQVYDNEWWNCDLGIVLAREAGSSIIDYATFKAQEGAAEFIRSLWNIDIWNNRGRQTRKAGIYFQWHPQKDGPDGRIGNIRCRFNTVWNANRDGTAKDLNLFEWSGKGLTITAVDFVGNAVWNDEGNVQFAQAFAGQAGFTFSGNAITDDPLFNDPENGDLSLRHGSPAHRLEPGYTEAWCAVDAAGNVRPALAHAGAFAWSSTVKVFLVAGQSNAISRADYDGIADWPDEVWQIGRAAAPATSEADGALVPAARPLGHWNQPVAGDMGWALQFSIDHLAANVGEHIVLVPVALGGTGFSDNRWNPGDDLFDDAVARTNALMAANRRFTFAGILWLQGENDTGSSAAANVHQAALESMIAAKRAGMTAANETTPFVLGEITPGYVAGNALCEQVQTNIAGTPSHVAYTAVASSSGLAVSDGTHFDGPSIRLFGSRFYAGLAIAAANTGPEPTAPAQVPGLTVTPGNNQNALSWGLPSSGRSPITDSRIEADTGSDFTIIADGVSADRTFIHALLTNGTAYTYRVSAMNALGIGLASATTSGTLTAGVPGPESGAVGHWLLGSDGSTLAGGRLTAVGTAPVLNEGYARWSGTQLQGYNTGVPDASTIAYRALVRMPTVGANCIFAGNNDLSTGRIMFYSDGPITFRLRTDPGAPGGNLYDIDTAFPANQWGFVAVSISGTSFVGYRGAAAGAITNVGTINGGTLKGNIGVANIGLNNAAVANPFDVAEAGIISAAKSVADWNEVYERSALRLAPRGITLP